jgi:uncharacterized protein (DUF1499 family)
MTLVVNDPAYLHVESRSAVFGFIDDLEFVRDDADNVIHVRAAARSGKYDFNVNRQLIEKIRDKLLKENSESISAGVESGKQHSN